MNAACSQAIKPSTPGASNVAIKKATQRVVVKRGQGCALFYSCLLGWLRKGPNGPNVPNGPNGHAKAYSKPTLSKPKGG